MVRVRWPGAFYPDFLPQIFWGYLASGTYSFNILFIWFDALSFIIDYFKVWDCRCHRWVNGGIAPRLKIHKPTFFSEIGIFQVFFQVSPHFSHFLLLSLFWILFKFCNYYLMVILPDLFMPSLLQILCFVSLSHFFSRNIIKYFMKS